MQCSSTYIQWSFIVTQLLYITKKVFYNYTIRCRKRVMSLHTFDTTRTLLRRYMDAISALFGRYSDTNATLNNLNLCANTFIATRNESQSVKLYNFCFLPLYYTICPRFCDATQSEILAFKLSCCHFTG
jgi:hypothetical protein